MTAQRPKESSEDESCKSSEIGVLSECPKPNCMVLSLAGYALVCFSGSYLEGLRRSAFRGWAKPEDDLSRVVMVSIGFGLGAWLTWRGVRMAPSLLTRLLNVLLFGLVVLFVFGIARTYWLRSR